MRVWVGVQIAGVRVAPNTAVTPFPVRVTGEPVTATFAVMVSVAFTVPIAVGVNLTLIVQVPAAGGKVAPQVPPAVPPGREKRGEEKASVIPVRFAVPVLCSVRVCDALVVAGVVTPTVNVSGPPVTLAIGAAAAPANSTAPISNPAPCGLVLPKKSVPGANDEVP